MSQAVFGLVAGPLTWSIVALRNSLVLHSLDQVPAPSQACVRRSCALLFDGRSAI